jgi:hypothetical protein
MDCPSCGRQQDPSNKFCDTCGSLISSDEDAPDAQEMFAQPAPPNNGIAGARYGSPPGYSGPRSAESASRPVVSRPVPRAPGGSVGPQPIDFRLAQGEQVLKAYEVVTLRTGLFKRQRGRGTLYVTDARVVFYVQVYPRGTQKASWLFQQTNLEDISGLSAIVSRRLNLGLAVLTLFCGLATLITLVSALLPLTFLFAILTAVLVVMVVRDANRRGDVGVIIQSRESANSPIAFGHLPRQRGFLDTLGRLLILPVALFLRSYSASDVVAGDPADHAGQLLHELGALIIDLQTRGTMAYPEWNIPVPAGAVGAARAQ